MNTPTQNLRVLIVDDAKSLRELLHMLLNKNGYLVVGELDDGSSVLSTVFRTQPDIVCLDLNMPNVDGMTVLKDMNVNYPDVAVVMMTGETSPAIYRQATELGAAGFLCKPFSPQQILDELGHVANALRLLRKEKERESSPAAASKNALRVVIADDSTTFRHLLRAILENMGMEVVGEAVDGQQAINIVLKEKPDLVCLDVEMPVLNGLMALEKIHIHAPDVQVMMITSHADRGTVQNAAKLGARGYIVKPFQPDKVAFALNKLFNR